MKLTPEHKRLLKASREQENDHLDAASAAVRAQYRTDLLVAAEKELARALALPPGERRTQLPRVLRLISSASAATSTPPSAVYRAIQGAVRDRVLSVDELARISDPTLSFNDSADLQARAVDRQRREMNRYWDKEQKRFRDDVAKVTRQVIRQGLRPDRAADLLQERLGVSRSRALLIAEDQLTTAAAAAEAARQQALGLQSYIWWSRLDPRVRRGHKLLHGKIRRWKDGERPGQAIRCRCRAIPVPRAR